MGMGVSPDMGISKRQGGAAEHHHPADHYLIAWGLHPIGSTAATGYRGGYESIARPRGAVTPVRRWRFLLWRPGLWWQWYRLDSLGLHRGLFAGRLSRRETLSPCGRPPLVDGHHRERRHPAGEIPPLREARADSRPLLHLIGLAAGVSQLQLKAARDFPQTPTAAGSRHSGKATLQTSGMSLVISPHQFILRAAV